MFGYREYVRIKHEGQVRHGGFWNLEHGSQVEFSPPGCDGVVLFWGDGKRFPRYARPHAAARFAGE